MNFGPMTQAESVAANKRGRVRRTGRSRGAQNHIDTEALWEFLVERALPCERRMIVLFNRSDLIALRTP